MTISADTKNRLGVALALASAGTEVADAIDANTGLADGKFLIGDANGVQAEKTLSGDVTSDREGVMTIGAQKIDGVNVKNNANVNVIGSIPVVFRIDLAAGALADTDVVMTHKVRVIDAFLILRGAGVASTTLQVKNTAAAITNAMAASGSDQALVRAATIDDAAYEIAAGGILRVTSATGATQPAATVYVTAVRVP